MKIRDLFESDDVDAEHFDALRRTGFFGAAGAGCVFLARTTGRFLIAHRSRAVEQPGTWGGWGGAINSGENPEEAVRREAQEESGHSGPFDFIPLFVFAKDTFRYYNYLCIVEDEFTPMLDWETQGYKWCEWGHWPQPLHFGLISLFNDPESVRKIKQVLQTIEQDDPIEEDVWHGSPYRFDKFSSEFSNKGSGSHMYGWGLYFSSLRKMTDQFKRSKSVYAVNGKQMAVPIWQEMPNTPEAYAVKVMNSTQNPKHELMLAIEGKSRDFQDPQTAEAALKLINSGAVHKIEGGSYNVKIPEIDQLLNWDAPLDEQSPYVIRILNEMGILPINEQPKIVKGIQGDDLASGWYVRVGWYDLAWSSEYDSAVESLHTAKQNPIDIMQYITGHAVYKQLSKQLGSDKAASLELRKHGIFGHYYINGPRNFVIYDPTLAKINFRDE